MFKFIISFLIILLCIGCKETSKKREYYIISYHDSINTGLLNGSIPDSLYPPPPPPFPQFLKWYSNVVFIFDSTDMVYIYQTEISRFEEKVKYTPIGDFYESEESHNIMDFDTMITDYNFPNYIGLQPEHLIALKSENFVDFIELNNDIFQLDTNSQSIHIFYVASNRDTIINKAFYDFDKLITKHERLENYIHYVVRRTTEEEDFVIYFKRHKKVYQPEKLEWKTDFINQNLKPFTDQYNIIEHRCYVIKRAKETFKKNSLKILPID